MAYAKSQISAFNPLPTAGNVFFSVSDRDKEEALSVARDLSALGFKIFSTSGTHRKLTEAAVPCERLFKLAGGKRPNVLDMMKNV